MRSKLMILFAVLVCLGPNVQAQPGGAVALYADPIGASGVLEDQPGLISVYVFVTLTPGAKAVQFSAPIPDCWNGAVFLGDIPVWPITLGSSQTGVAISFGGPCLPAPVHVMTINIFSSGLVDGCCPYPVLPPTNGNLEIVDCSDTVLPAQGFRLLVSDGDFPRARNIGPPDGATFVDFDADLTWWIETCTDVLCGKACVPFADLGFGTDPNPALSIPFATSPFDPGPLAPQTTYYWRVQPRGEGLPVSPVWSFTTQPPTPIQPNTWGAIKALYR